MRSGRCLGLDPLGLRDSFCYFRLEGRYKSLSVISDVKPNKLPWRGSNSQHPHYQHRSLAEVAHAHDVCRLRRVPTNLNYPNLIPGIIVVRPLSDSRVKTRYEYLRADGVTTPPMPPSLLLLIGVLFLAVSHLSLDGITYRYLFSLSNMGARRATHSRYRDTNKSRT